MLFPKEAMSQVGKINLSYNRVIVLLYMFNIVKTESAKAEAAWKKIEKVLSLSLSSKEN